MKGTKVPLRQVGSFGGQNCNTPIQLFPVCNYIPFYLLEKDKIDITLSISINLNNIFEMRNLQQCYNRLTHLAQIVQKQKKTPTVFIDDQPNEHACSRAVVPNIFQITAHTTKCAHFHCKNFNKPDYFFVSCWLMGTYKRRLLTQSLLIKLAINRKCR